MPGDELIQVFTGVLPVASSNTWMSIIVFLRRILYDGLFQIHAYTANVMFKLIRLIHCLGCISFQTTTAVDYVL